MSVLLSIADLHMSYGKNEVLKGVDLAVQKGERVIIMGPSGSGKSTLLRCINHLEKASAGTMVFDGRTIDLANWHKDDIQYMRLNTSMVFQNYNLFTHMTTLENVMEGLVHVRKMNRLEAKEIALHYLDKTGMIKWQDCYPSTLSGGQQQRVGIARALALQPKLVMFDEPTSALDPELVGEVLNVMKQVALEGITMLVVTHEVAFARDVADTIVILDGGKIVEKGSTQNVLQNPQNPRAKKFFKMLGD
jgi:L-cystine transport system ATP-binding protein